MERYYFSIIVKRHDIIAVTPCYHENRTTFIHSCWCILANNEAEATGKCWQVLYKLYPVKDGWMDHHFAIWNGKVIVDPGTVTLI